MPGCLLKPLMPWPARADTPGMKVLLVVLLLAVPACDRGGSAAPTPTWTPGALERTLPPHTPFVLRTLVPRATPTPLPPSPRRQRECQVYEYPEGHGPPQVFCP
jgi:hypothetical protein